ncbi:MAG: GNAT family N-acetyltransferase [Clostridia bacterium]|nr:GNAT family N-acetyltransferase [Clostridia bacterium]
MIEYLSKNNLSDFEKLFNKSLKKHEFEDIRLSENQKCILLCKEGSNYVGFLEGIINKDSITNKDVGVIMAVYVLPSYRNEGKAYSMITEFENWIKQNNCKNIVVAMSAKNKKSLDFFEKIAFENVCTCVCMKKSI